MAGKKILAFDLGSQRVVGARFQITGPAEVQLEAYEIVEMLGDPAADSSRIQQIEQAVAELTNTLKAGTTDTYYAMSGQSVFTRFIKLPPLGDDNVERMVQFEAQQNVPFPMNEVVWDYQFTGKTKSGEIEALLVAIKAESLNEYNDAVGSAGLKTSLVDVAPLALYNSFRYSYGDTGEPCVLVDIGARSTNLIYSDGDKFFVRTIPVGGSQITSSIAKEFRVPFAQAEDHKIKRGFVSLGGAYADHEDPQVAAMSKVIRNTLGRLHTEFGRTTNVFRSQQGGRAPVRAYLSGGSASLPYLREFFEEKLGIPVEYYNPLQKVDVAISGGAGGEKISAEAHTLGEVVGLALRAAGTVPVELDLVPFTVERTRDANRRKPFLILTTLGLVGLLGAGIVYFKRAAGIAEAKTAALSQEKGVLAGFDSKIQVFKNTLAEVESAADPLTSAVSDRTYWVRLFHDLNSRFEDDLIWYTKIEPLSESRELTAPIAGGGGGAGFFGGGGASSQAANQTPAAPGAEKKAAMVDALSVSGLFRAEAGSAIVTQLVEKLRESPFLNLPPDLDLAEIIKFTGSEDLEGRRWAYKFELLLPLMTEEAPFAIAVQEQE